MSSERPEEFSAPPASKDRQTSDDKRDSEIAEHHGSSDHATRHEATVMVRGETVREQAPMSAPAESPPKDKEKSPRKKVSEAKTKMKSRLPALSDDPDVGVQKQQGAVARVSDL
jgi:hypothetical protein